MTGPAGIVAGGVGAAVGVLTGLGPIGAVVGAIAAWVIRVGVAVPRPERGSTTRIDAFALNEPWKRLVRDAQQAEQNFQRALHGTPQGPLRDRLGEIRAHLNEGVAEVWEIAKSGNAVGMGRADQPTGSRGRVGRDTSATRCGRLPQPCGHRRGSADAVGHR